MFIKLKPNFEINENIILPLSKNVEFKDIEYFYVESKSYQFLDAEVRKSENGYNLIIYNNHEISTDFIDNALNLLSSFIENTHFVYYSRQPARWTFGSLELTEFIIKNKKYNKNTMHFKTAVPSCKFLDLEAGGVQQMFNFDENYLFESMMWKNNNEIKEYLENNIIWDISYYLENRNINNFLPSLIQYGESFALNNKAGKLKQLLNNDLNKYKNIINNLVNIQTEERKILINAIKEKYLSNTNFAVQNDILNIELQLNIKFPQMLKELYLQIGDGDFGPGLGFFPVKNSKNNIIEITLKLRELYSEFSKYLIPFMKTNNGIYFCIDCLDESFPVIYFNSNIIGKDKNIYDSFKQKSYSFEEWLDNWVNEIFPELYENT